MLLNARLRSAKTQRCRSICCTLPISHRWSGCGSSWGQHRRTWSGKFWTPQGKSFSTSRQRFSNALVSLSARASLLAELAKQADGLAAGLLVCGAKGESLVRHFVLGTTALRILSTTICPVLVVKQSPREPYHRLLVPVDFSPSSLRAIRHARRIAPRADIVLLHAFDVPFEGQLRYASVDEDTIHHYRIVAKQEATQKLHALRDEAGLDRYGSSLVVLHGDPTMRIIEQEQEWGCDLIVMGKHGENLLEELLIGSVTKHVLAESQCDILISV